jgi:hypothetical protein
MFEGFGVFGSGYVDDVLQVLELRGYRAERLDNRLEILKLPDNLF